MEDYCKNQGDTTSSNFNTTGLRAPSPPKAVFHTSEPQPNTNRIPELEAKLSALVSIVEQLKQHNQRMRGEGQLEEWQKEQLTSLEDMKSDGKSVDQQIKLGIQQKFENLDRELQEASRNRKAMKGKYEKLLGEGLEQAKQVKKQSVHQLARLKQERGSELRKKMQQLKKECQTLKKSQKSFRCDTFGELELMRVKFEERLSNEEANRNNLENILQSLLEKTCVKAEASLRRRLCGEKPLERVRI